MSTNCLPTFQYHGTDFQQLVFLRLTVERTCGTGGSRSCNSGSWFETRMFEYFILHYFICMHSYPALFLKQFLPQGWFRLSSVLGHVVVVCKQMRLTLHRRQEYKCIYTNSMLGQVVPFRSWHSSGLLSRGLVELVRSNSATVEDG